MTMLCTICARGGSKGVPDKNVRDILGKPLIAYTIEQARQSGLFSSIAVSSELGKNSVRGEGVRSRHPGAPARMSLPATLRQKYQPSAIVLKPLSAG